MKPGVISVPVVGPVDNYPFLPHKENLKIEGEVGNFHTFTNKTKEQTTISFDPAIKNGVVKFEVLNINNIQGIGIVDKPVTYFEKKQAPDANGKDKIIEFSNLGMIFHIEEYLNNLEGIQI
ncbi:MAG: hypothetical protein EZS28_003582 [Streblomastix strix]|uniref:Uncharacterized protein n=1 Tax=Streblomastix strix TaxID=222440 RepID=A0A5J4X341_9EUKA|nr:MAG: hypothetical protein EZS28_003582 [Streblomastix strix]